MTNACPLKKKNKKKQQTNKQTNKHMFYLLTIVSCINSMRLPFLTKCPLE